MTLILKPGYLRSCKITVSYSEKKYKLLNLHIDTRFCKFEKLSIIPLIVL